MELGSNEKGWKEPQSHISNAPTQVNAYFLKILPLM